MEIIRRTYTGRFRKNIEAKLKYLINLLFPKSFDRRIHRWFEDRGIIQHSTPQAQLTKLEEEFLELVEGIDKDEIDEIKDAIGDMAVVLSGIAIMYDLTLTECKEHAWNEIKYRTGKLDPKSGIFVKQEDLNE